MKKFDADLAALKRQLVDMGGIGQAMIAQAMKALVDRDTSLIAVVRDEEEKMDRYHVEIDNAAIRMLTVYTPVAADLRLLLMVSRINSELERIGDHAINMCGYVEMLVAEPELKPLIDLPRMAVLACGMVHGALEAFVGRDAEKATQIRNSDDQVDNLNDQIFRELLTYVADSPKNIKRAVALILTARALERVADHATNICEEIVYWVLGEDIRHVEVPSRRGG
jgi:phosphate transport system protein